jgi:hypothetical protein
LFCRIIEKIEEHQKSVQIHAIPETVPETDYSFLIKEKEDLAWW